MIAYEDIAPAALEFLRGRTRPCKSDDVLRAIRPGSDSVSKAHVIVVDILHGLADCGLVVRRTSGRGGSNVTWEIAQRTA